MERGTLLFFDVGSRTAALGWASGEVDFTVFSLDIADAELGAMLAAYGEPIPIKNGTHVEVPVMPQNPASSMLDDDSYEQIALTEYAILSPLGMRRFLAGYGPRSERWYVRQA